MDERKKTIRTMQEYISEHIFDGISVKDIAKNAFVSPSYARKLFIKYLGMSPAVYIRRLKLSMAALRLRDEKRRILDVALDSGYGSADGYQRAFRHEFGCNPKEYSSSPVPIWLFTPYLISYTERENKTMKNYRTVFIQVIEKPKRKVIIKRGIKATEYMSYCNEVGCDVWGLLKSIKSISGEPVCLWLPKKLRNPVTNEYVQGVEVESDYDGLIPDGFDVINLPEASYILFRGEPFEDEDFENAIEEIWDAESKYNPKFIGFEWDDENPRIQLEPIGNRGYIELVPVKKINQ